MLLSSDKTVAETAHFTGFREPALLFQGCSPKGNGVSPNEYKKRVEYPGQPGMA